MNIQNEIEWQLDKMVEDVLANDRYVPQHIAENSIYDGFSRWLIGEYKKSLDKSNGP